MFALYSARIRFTLFFGPSAGFWGGLGTYRPVWASGGRMELVPGTWRRGQQSMCTAPLQRLEAASWPAIGPRQGRLRGSGREVLCTRQPAGRLTQHGTLPSMPKLDCVA